jgi:hypothetical protein
MAEYTDFETFTDYDIFDCDQHLYEPGDCYTNWIEAKYKDRTLRGVEQDGRWLVLAEDREVPTDFNFDECYRPGSLKEMLKSIKGGTATTGSSSIPRSSTPPCAASSSVNRTSAAR